MELPETVICRRCGATARVPRQSIDEDAAEGQLRGFDQAWAQGYGYTIECPQCGRIDQQFEPPRTS